MKRTKYITYLFLFLLYGLLSSCSFEQEDSLLLSSNSGSFSTLGTVINTERITIDSDTYGTLLPTNYNPQIEMFARFKMKSSFHKTKRII